MAHLTHTADHATLIRRLQVSYGIRWRVLHGLVYVIPQ